MRYVVEKSIGSLMAVSDIAVYSRFKFDRKEDKADSLKFYLKSNSTSTNCCARALV